MLLVTSKQIVTLFLNIIQDQPSYSASQLEASPLEAMHPAEREKFSATYGILETSQWYQNDRFIPKDFSV